MQEGTSPEFRRVWLRPCWPNCTVDRLARTGWSPTHFRRDYTTSKGFARLIYADADSTFVLEDVDWPDDPASYSGGAADVLRGCEAAERKFSERDTVHSFAYAQELTHTFFRVETSAKTADFLTILFPRGLNEQSLCCKHWLVSAGRPLR